MFLFFFAFFRLMSFFRVNHAHFEIYSWNDSLFFFRARLSESAKEKAKVQGMFSYLLNCTL